AHLLAALNRGTPQEASLDITSLLSPYPPSAPAHLPSFPAAYLEEVTGDSLPDLICANNDPLTGEDLYSVWLYENQGKVDSPRWALPHIGWLQHSMLELGTNAHPTLADLNRDGYPDLILSAERIGKGVRVFLLEGKRDGFILRDTNWLALAQVNERQFLFTVGDIDRDGAMDLLAGTSGGSLWHWEENPPSSLSFTLHTTRWENISAPPFAAPFLYDLDSDGDSDLLIGGRDGRIAYFQQHQGRFELVTDFLGQIHLRDTLSSLLGFARPAVGDIDRDGTPELIVGNLTGFLYAYRMRPEAPGGVWPRKYRLGYRYGKRASPTLWQQGDSVLLLVGNLRGGVHAFTPGDIQTEPTALKESMSEHLPCLFQEGEVLYLYDLAGQLVRETRAPLSGDVELPVGAYIAVSERGFPCRVIWLGRLGSMQSTMQAFP
ncbi:MAG: VCBS repeat-containing protein, partial [Bacteroidia bacterium]|nr:VCBS repeat-containing protein [Bacteroidia bacterium]